MGNDDACKTIGIGSIQLKNQDGSTRVLTDVRYVPSLKKNLISLGALESKGSVVTMRDGVLKVTSGALVILKGIRKNNLYYYQGSTVIGAVATASDNKELDSMQLWHMKLGHASEKSLKILAKQGLLKGAKACKLKFCEHCVLGKQKRVKFGTAIHNTKGILEYVHLDVWGPSKTPSLRGKHYFVTFVDDFSRRVWVYSMRTKDEVLCVFLKWKTMIENQTGKKIKQLKTDNGRNIKVIHSSMCAKSMVRQAIWAEAVTYASHLVNRLSSSALERKTPMEGSPHALTRRPLRWCPEDLGDGGAAGFDGGLKSGAEALITEVGQTRLESSACGARRKRAETLGFPAWGCNCLGQLGLREFWVCNG
ncbi:hypothetical protein CXB51_000383 [Gossypium anomalum]|uniref:Uncharacterized protein n=1 Tax=Gossypium anomalum TaxID=47600 RepID=A0A8J5Z9I8_9ROSI|nr:hypothetical protein CXB51_000383 [Gossypium anomalum]